MSGIDATLEASGHHDLWTWLVAHPTLLWTEVGQRLDVTPIVAIKRMVEAAPTQDLAARQLMLRYLYQYFPQGWDAGETFSRAKLAGKLGSRLKLSDNEVDSVMSRLREAPQGWLPLTVNDPVLECVTGGLGAG